MNAWQIALFVSPLLALGGCSQPVENTVEEPLPATEESLLTLEVGTCLNDVDQPIAQELTSVPLVDCGEPHQSEVYAEVVIDDATYPGIDELNTRAASVCEDEFGRFIGLDYSVSTLSFHFYYPTFSSWAVGDRSIYCVVFDPGVDTTGSLRGAAR